MGGGVSVVVGSVGYLGDAMLVSCAGEHSCDSSASIGSYDSLVGSVHIIDS